MFDLPACYAGCPSWHSHSGICLLDKCLNHYIMQTLLIWWFNFWFYNSKHREISVSFIASPLTHYVANLKIYLIKTWQKPSIKKIDLGGNEVHEQQHGQALSTVTARKFLIQVTAWECPIQFRRVWSAHCGWMGSLWFPPTKTCLES